MRRAGTAGFTLLEMLVVIVIAGLLASLIVSRGPLRSRALAFAMVRDKVERVLEEAREEAISGGGDVIVQVDQGAHMFVVSSASHAWRAGFDPKVQIVVGGRASGVPGGNQAIRFGAAGGTAGGAFGGPLVVMYDGRRCVFDVSELTGRVIEPAC
ncbi:hypothetical protein GFGA_2d0028 (plasmid) [Gluconobacter frateurii NBRC 103465]|nr:hypothetical protein GFGA_2d0028 [Gluconobacter frateurii NBRC 103465]